MFWSWRVPSKELPDLKRKHGHAAWLNLILINIQCKLATGTACFVHLFHHERRWSSSQHEHKSQAIFCTPARCWHLPSVLRNRVFSFRANGSECYFWNYSITSDYNVKLSLEPAAGLGLWVEILSYEIWLNFVENGPCILGGDLKKGRIQLKSWRRKETQPTVPPLSRSESLPAMSKCVKEGKDYVREEPQTWKFLSFCARALSIRTELWPPRFFQGFHIEAICHRAVPDSVTHE